MKQVLISLFYSSKNNLDKMEKSKMRLSDRIAYEKALTQIEIMK